MRKQLALRIFDRKILLMIAHHRYQNFFGKLKKFRIKAAENCRRPFGEVDNDIQQSLIFAPTRAGYGPSNGIECFANLMLTVSPAENFGATKSVKIRRASPGNANFAAGENSVPTRLPFCANPA